MRRLQTGILLLPFAALCLCAFIVPMLLFFLVSFWKMQGYAMRPAFTLANYQRAVSSYVGALGYTMVLATIVALICVVVALAAGWMMRFKARRWEAPLLGLVLVTMFGGYLEKIYAWKTILGNEGVLNSALLELGLIDQPLTWLLYSRGAVVATMTYFLVPFAILPIYADLRSVKDVQLEAAQDLAASRWKAFLTVVLPQCRYGVTSAFALCLLFAMGDYITPVLVGGGSVNLYSQLIAPTFGTLFNWPLGSSMAFSLLAASVLVIFVFNRLLRWAVAP